MKYFSIAFMGNCDFSFSILKYLFNYNYNISVVVISSNNNTKNYSIIKNFALSNNINILEFCNILDLKFIKKLKSYNFDIQVIVSFKFVPKIIFDIPSLGALNLHISLLPYYSGAAPIN
jgi:methionyl-tRNA formyltransferase